MSRDEPATFPNPPGDHAVRIRCPHCGNRIQLVESGLREVVCGSCGSSFHVDPDATNSLAPEKLPKRVGRFVVLARLGRGAFGTVYKATDPDLDRVVAVKVPRAGFFATADEEARFLREAKAAAKLQHPGIVTVHEVADGDPPAIVSELIDGVTLADKLTAGRATVRESAELIAALADALDYAHRSGVVHRDVKPSNVLLDAAGRPHLADFGLARRDEAEITVTRDGQVLGTPAYMSPEQAAGRAAVDGRADVYSLGVMLYELLAGELPFRGNVRMLLHQVLHDAPKPPRKLNDHIPRDLETVCLKALAKTPARRYATAGELAADLRRWLSGQPVLARPVGRLERGWRWVMRNKAVAGLLATLWLVLCLVAGSSLAAAAQFRRMANEQAGLRRQAERREGELAVEKGVTLGDRGEVKAGLLWQAKGLAILDRTGADEQDIWYARMSLSLWGQALVTPPARYNSKWQQAELVDGKTLFVARTGEGVSHDIGLHDLATGKLVHLFPRPGSLNLASSNPQFHVSSDGRSLGTVHTVFTDEKQTGQCLVVTVWDLDTRTERSQFRIDTFDSAVLIPCRLVWSPRLSYLAIEQSVSDGPDVRQGYYLYDLRTGKKLDAPTVEIPTDLKFAPDDRSAVGSVKGYKKEDSTPVWLLDTATGRKLAPVGDWDAFGLINSFSPDGREVVGWHLGKLRRYDPRTGKSSAPPLDCPFVPDTTAFSADGRWLTAHAYPTEGEDKWAAWAWPSGEPWPHRDVQPTYITPDGTVALLNGFRPVRWPSRDPLIRLLPVVNVFHGFSADGAVAVIRSKDGLMECWTTRCGRRIGPSEFDIRLTAETTVERWDNETGQFILHGSDRTGKRFLNRSLRPVVGTPELTTLWAQVVTGMELDDAGNAHPLDESALAERKKRLEELGGSPLPKP